VTKGIEVNAVAAGKIESNPQQSYLSDDAFEIHRKAAQKLRERGIRGVVGLRQAFKTMDRDGSRTLNRSEFAKAMIDYRIAEDRL